MNDANIWGAVALAVALFMGAMTFNLAMYLLGDYIDGRRGKILRKPMSWTLFRLGRSHREQRRTRWEHQLHAALFFQAQAERMGATLSHGYASQQAARIAKLRRKLGR